MEELSGIPSPDGYSYTTVINCFARSIGELAILSLHLYIVENEYRTNTLVYPIKLAPFIHSYTCFARHSSVDRKAKKAREVLDKMIQSYSAGNKAAKP